MTLSLHLPDLRHGYVDVVRAVVETGDVSAPRGELTREVLGAYLRIDDPQDVLPVGVGRKASPKLGAIEALQLVGGYSDVEQCKRVSKALSNFEDLGRFHGAYGPRAYPQVLPAIRRLVQDPESRRAVINIWDPVQDLLVDGVKNYPCTTQLQFMLRYPSAIAAQEDRPELHLFVTMRANDAWKGLAYDAFTFAQLQFTIANALGVPVGQYHHYATSLHVYESDLEKVSGLVKNPDHAKPATGIGRVHSDWPLVKYDWPLAEHRLRKAFDRARTIGDRRELERPTQSEFWYLETLAGLL